MPDPVSVDTIAEAANSPVSTTTDGLSVTAVSIPDQIAADKYRAAGEALEGTNSTGGGPVSGWSKMRMARAKNCGGPQ